MTQKHFIIIAERINTSLRGCLLNPATCAVEQNAILLVARGLGDDFAEINPRFNRQRFLLACVQGTSLDPE